MLFNKSKSLKIRNWREASGGRVVAKAVNAATGFSTTHDDAISTSASLTFYNIPGIRQHLTSAGKWIFFH
jgi:hypothetical protein